MYDRRSGHSAKNLSRDDPIELKRAGPCGSVVCVFGTVVVVDFTTADVEVVVVEPDDAECELSPEHAAMVRAAAATIAAEESARVMPIRRCDAHDWFPS